MGPLPHKTGKSKQIGLSLSRRVFIGNLSLFMIRGREEPVSSLNPQRDSKISSRLEGRPAHSPVGVPTKSLPYSRTLHIVALQVIEADPGDSSLGL